MRIGFSIIMCVLFGCNVFAADAAKVLKESGVKGGIVVLIGCESPAELAGLRAGEAYVVHGLDTDAKKIQAARTYLSARKINGPISASLFDGERLPYTNNLVNLLIAEKPGSLTRAEALRVLAPLGVAILGGEKIVKPWPHGMDEWPQYLRGADNNAVSKDRFVGPPRHMQWVAAPNWSRSHMALSTVNSMVTAQGRFFSIEDKTTPENPFLPGRFSLVVRDAFNGVVLWEHAFKTWEPITRYIKDLAIQMQRRVVAVGDKVFCTPGIDAPVTLFDAATGKVLKIYEGTKDTQELVVHDGILYAVVGDRMNAARYNIVKTYSGKGISSGGTQTDGPFDGAGFQEGYSREFEDMNETKCAIQAIEADSGKVLWREGGIINYVAATLALQGDTAVYMTNGGLKSLNAKTGDKNWEVEKKIDASDGTEASPLVISGDSVYTYEGKGIVAYNLKNGAEKWKAAAKKCYEKSADLFVIKGIPWTGGMGAPTSHDPATGMPIATHKQKMNGPMGHDRCYRNFITETYYINSKTGGADFINLADGGEFPNHWVRGTCGMGVLPANGLLYAPPYACQCSEGAMIKSFNALASEPNLATPDQAIPVERKIQLVKGPFFGRAPGPAATASDWPVYRNDNTRGASNGATISGNLTEKWKAQFIGTPSPPIVADGKVFLADIDAHTVHALNAADGKALWQYVAGGRIDSPPTYYKGLILFGSRDGWVTCLSAADGALSWKFKDLPDRLVGAFGQLESAWPVNGSVLVQNDTVYFAAGRSSFLDGGIFLYALNPRTGEVKNSRGIYGPFDEENGFPAVKGGKIDSPGDGFKTDILVSDGETLYIRHRAFNGDLTNAIAKPHLMPSAGFTDGTPQCRTYWTIDTKFSLTRVKGVESDILALDGEEFFAIQGFQTHRHSYFDPRKSGYRLTGGCLSNADQSSEETKAKETKRRRGKGAAAKDADKAAAAAKPKPSGETLPNPGELWVANIPLTGKAILKAGDTLVIAGTPMNYAQDQWREFVDSYEQRSGGVLYLASSTDGKKISETKLPAPPAWDGLAASEGQIFIALQDGTLRCMGE